ncbi:hypothetical protein OH146_10095 [Salinibacterium sp. SYSU T00001]|uniref:hypothetical protein n=1 Tax=Homoserinimonas sedimenticola TaxID=2986805 RepID=UPI002235AF1F|nr:hypothetical protein [Salinibacterium sedimenticola]MCW4386123.1 hypothetical protein [Salinibacterium sedimenticola]
MTLDESQAPSRATAWMSVVVVWVVVVAGAVLTVIFAKEDARLQWFPIVLAISTILSFCLQLALDSKVGFVNRLSASVTGSVVILAASTGLLALAAMAGG